MENPNWRQVLASILGISMLGLIGYLGGARTKSGSPSEPPKRIQPLVQNSPSTAVVPPAEKEPEKKIVLDIGGAVSKPGVYWLFEGARLDELVVLAGGLLPDADRERINMALVLKDGAKVSIPFRTQVSASAPTQTPNSLEPEPLEQTESSQPTASEPRVLSINQATSTELESLPSIGHELATRIVKYREGVGGFKSVDEIKQVRGIGDKLFEKIRAYLTL